MEIDEATKEIYRQWLWVLGNPPHQTYADKPIRAICNALRDMTARALEAEWKLSPHHAGVPAGNPKCKKNWDNADWQADAHRLLMGEEPPK